MQQFFRPGQLFAVNGTHKVDDQGPGGNPDFAVNDGPHSTARSPSHAGLPCEDPQGADPCWSTCYKGLAVAAGGSGRRLSAGGPRDVCIVLRVHASSFKTCQQSHGGWAGEGGALHAVRRMLYPSRGALSPTQRRRKPAGTVVVNPDAAAARRQPRVWRPSAHPAPVEDFW